MLAAKLQILGWDIDRGCVARIESRLAHVNDCELLYLARLFKVGLSDLFPKIDSEKRIHDVITALMRRE